MDLELRGRQRQARFSEIRTRSRSHKMCVCVCDFSHLNKYESVCAGCVGPPADRLSWRSLLTNSVNFRRLYLASGLDVVDCVGP